MVRSFAIVTAILILAMATFFVTQGEPFTWAQEQDSTDITAARPARPNAISSEPPTMSGLPMMGATPPSSTGTRPPAATAASAKQGEEAAMDGGMPGAMMGGSGGMMGTDAGGMMGMMPGEMMGSMGAPNPQLFKQQLHESTEILRRAKTPHAREQAQKTMERLLGGYFDADMQRRQAELNQVKQRVARLESLFEKRQAAKQEIIELQLKTMVNESEGLGFFSKPASSSGVGSGFGGTGTAPFGMGAGYGGYGNEMMGGEYGSGGYGMEDDWETPDSKPKLPGPR